MTCAQGLLRLLWGGGPKLECYGTGPRKDDGIKEAKFIGLSLRVVKGRSLTIRTAFEVKVCCSISRGFRRALTKIRLKAFLKSLTILSQLPPWLGANWWGPYPVNIAFAKQVVKLSRAKQRRKLLSCGTKSRSIICVLSIDCPIKFRK